MRGPITNVLVPGRGHDVLADGSLSLSDSAMARVETVGEYYLENVEAFETSAGRILFEGGWAKGATGIDRPPVELREGRLMRDLATDLGMPEKIAAEGIESTTTMTNVLNSRNFFGNVGSLAIVTQLSQADRFNYFAKRVYPDAEVEIIEAPGEDDPEIIADEQRLLRQSRILYGWAWSPRTLRLADTLGVFAGNLVNLQPGAKYTSNSTA
jgi:uncharacterized SAM-binding protein YcdF (DUF218 family)